MVQRNKRDDFELETVLEYKHDDGTRGWLVEVRSKDGKRQKEEGWSGASKGCSRLPSMTPEEIEHAKRLWELRGGM